MATEHLHIRRDERYPDYSIDDTQAGPWSPYELDVDTDTAARWRQTFAAYEAMQDEIEAELAKNPKYYDPARGLWMR